MAAKTTRKGKGGKAYEPKVHEAPVTWLELLREAVEEPGVISDAYSRFYGYSIGNQMLVLWQMRSRGIAVSPVATYNKWQELGRQVRKGERALLICMPRTFTVKASAEDRESWTRRAHEHGADGGSQVRAIKSGALDEPPTDKTFTKFVYKPVIFAMTQTDGEDVAFPAIPAWDRDAALRSLGFELVPFEHTDGNTQGYCQPDLGRIAINPVAKRPEKTMMHELGHAVLHKSADREELDRPDREVEAELVALIVTNALGIASDESNAEMRGYVQSWIAGGRIDDKTARRVFSAANTILTAGRSGHNVVEIETAA